MANLHPNYKEVEVVMTDGTSFHTRSTASGNTMHLAVDRLTHPAWNKSKGNYVNQNAGAVAGFNQKFGNLFG